MKGLKRSNRRFLWLWKSQQNFLNKWLFIYTKKTVYLKHLEGICSVQNHGRYMKGPGFANFIDEWSHCDFCFTNFGVTLEYLESSIRLSSKWSWHVYTIMRDTRSSCGGPLTWKAQIHDGGHQVNFDRNLPSSCFVVQHNSLISMI